MAKQIATRKVVEGLKELQDNVADILERVDGMELQAGLRGIAVQGARMLEAEASAKGWPKKAIESIFVYGQLPPEKRQKRGPSALFGFRKRGREPYAPGYVEWFPGRSASKRAKSLVLPGTMSAKGAEHGLQKIGMSLATMYEFGTSKLRARPAMRTVIAQLKAGYPEQVGKLLQNILAKHGKTQPGTE